MGATPAAFVRLCVADPAEGVGLSWSALRYVHQTEDFVESLNGGSRNECLNKHPFVSLDWARQIADRRIDYNTSLP
jgi:hypothetical protein